MKDIIQPADETANEFCFLGEKSKIKKRILAIMSYTCVEGSLALSIEIASSLLPNHRADAFDPPEDSCTSVIDCFLRWLLDGFHKWDAIYFHFISMNGYLYENTLVFFPLFPIVLRFVSDLLYAFVPLCSFWTHSILIGVFLCFLCNLLSAIQMYRLSKLVLMNNSLSLVSALLFVINPASVFFTTLYSEALYSFLFLSALIWIHERNYTAGCLILSMTVCCRSNGLVNCGFPCFFRFICFVKEVKSLYKKGRGGFLQHLCSPLPSITAAAFNFFLALSVMILCVISPYLMYQCYAGFLYCYAFPKSSSFTFLLPRAPNSELYKLADELGVLTPYSVNSSFHPDWCAGVPWSSYMLLQKRFWGVDTLAYYRWKQVPNFLLALPVLFLVFKTVSLFGQKAAKTLFSFGIFEDSIKQRLLLPYVYHALFLSAYGIVNVHIQVLTRMLFSSCPVLYWYCASVLLNEQDNLFGRPRLRKAKIKANLMFHQPKNLFHLVNPLRYPPWSSQRMLLYYFYSYIAIGCIMHSNFLPWT
ncbi:unnamed protein product [Hydatigera taeniaeformis]|uniref:GPI mannosyltransferase 2 n=1 Tax=Hydatigena taeniaeformis TaxID=6205 RepID=A0A0R3X6D3_HYDTA|nr:unnamed protein product [Hydatigera taeniaeformis]